MRAAIFYALVIAIGVVASSAAAQPASEAQADPILTLPEDEALRALGLLDQGDAARSAGRYQEAIEAYLAVIAIVEHDGVWLDIAECRIALGEYEAAAWILERLSASEDPARAAQAEAALVELYDAHPARIVLTTSTDGARCAIGEQPEQAVGTTGATFVVRGGTHEIRCRANGYRAHIATTWLSPGARVEEHVVLEPQTVNPGLAQPVVPGANPDDSGGTERSAAAVAVPTTTGALSLAAFGAAAAFGVTANQRADEYNTYDVTDPRASLDDWDDLARQSQDAARRSNIMIGVGSGLAVATVASAIAFRAHGRANERRVTLAPVWGRDGVGAAASMRW